MKTGQLLDQFHWKWSHSLTRPEIVSSELFTKAPGAQIERQLACETENWGNSGPKAWVYYPQQEKPHRFSWNLWNRRSEAQARDRGRGKGALSTPLAVGGEGPIAAAQTPSPLRHFPLKGARIVSSQAREVGNRRHSRERRWLVSHTRLRPQLVSARPRELRSLPVRSRIPGGATSSVVVVNPSGEREVTSAP